MLGDQDDQVLISAAQRVVRDRERAEDLVQEVFIRVYRHLHRFDRSKKFSTWAYTIASNLAKNELRNRSRNPLVLFQTLGKGAREEDDRPLEFEDSSTRPDDLYRKRHLRELVEETVAQLPDGSPWPEGVEVPEEFVPRTEQWLRMDEGLEPGHRNSLDAAQYGDRVIAVTAAAP